jgi:hypothetical protein
MVVFLVVGLSAQAGVLVEPGSICGEIAEGKQVQHADFA